MCSLFSPLVKVYRRCLSNRRWTSVDFSGCVLSSNEQKVLVILSLRASITGSRPSNISFEEKVKICYAKTYNTILIIHVYTLQHCICAVKGDSSDGWRICSIDLISHITTSDFELTDTTSVEGVLHYSRTGISWTTGEHCLQFL